MRKMINSPQDVVAEYLHGLALAHSDVVRIDNEHRIVTRAAEPREPKVGLVSGGGSGCEPLHAASSIPIPT